VSIRFETTVEHLIAFNRFHYENSPTWRKQRLVQSLIVPALASVVMWIFWSGVAQEPPIRMMRGRLPVPASDIPYGLIAVLLVFAIGSFFFIRWRATANLEWSVRKLLAEGSNRAVLGWCEMSLAGNRVAVKREWMDSSFDLRAVQKIVKTDDYTFLYVSSVNAIVIPMRLFPEDEYRDFVADLTDAWENRNAPPPTGTPDERIRLAKT